MRSYEQQATDMATMTDAEWEASDLASPEYQSQAAFEAMFPVGYTPKIDTRTPAQVKAGASA